MIRTSILTLLCFVSIICYSQDKKEYNRVLKSAFHVHDTASTYESSLYAAKMLEEVADKFPDEWLANYWAAYIHTQCGLYYPNIPEDAGTLFPANAQKNIELAMKRYKGDSSEILSDLHALQSFVYYTYTWYPDNKPMDSVYNQKSQEHTRMALNLNPDNPIVYVVIGTGMLRSEKIEDVLAGRALLYRAQTIFKQVSEHPVMTAHWNENWLRFRWLKYSDQRLREITEDKG